MGVYFLFKGAFTVLFLYPYKQDVGYHRIAILPALPNYYLIGILLILMERILKRAHVKETRIYALLRVSLSEYDELEIPRSTDCFYDVFFNNIQWLLKVCDQITFGFSYKM